MAGQGVQVVLIPVGQSKTIDVNLFSDADTRGPFMVLASDNGVMPHLDLKLDAESGRNGQTLIGYNLEEDRRRHTVTDSGVVVVTTNDEPLTGVPSDEALRFEAEADGTYRATALAVGDYEVKAQASGFAPYFNPKVTLALGRSTTLDIALPAGDVNAQVTVTDIPPALDATQTAVAQATETLNVTEEGYRQGVRTYLEILDAQLTLSVARNNRAQAEHDYSVALGQLDQAMGLATGASDSGQGQSCQAGVASSQ